MNVRRIGWLGLGGLTITLGGACQLISGLSDLHDTGSAGSTGSGGGTGGAGTTGSGGASSSTTASSTTASSTTSASASSSTTSSSTTSSSTSSASASSSSGGDCLAAGSQCLMVPSGWTPVAFDEGNKELVPCPPGSLEQYRGGMSPQGSAQCSPCKCQAGVCSKSTITLFTATSDCSGAMNIMFPEPSVVCDNNGGVTAHSAMQSVVAAACPSSGGALTAPMPTWATADLACALPVAPGSCSSGQCIAAPGPPYQLCLSHAGNVTCPLASMSMMHLFYTGVVDNTSCSACSCDAPACSGNSGLYTSLGCPGMPAVTLTPGVCASIPGGIVPQSFQTALVAPPCLPSGGTPGGALTADPSTAVTVCCP